MAIPAVLSFTASNIDLLAAVILIPAVPLLIALLVLVCTRRPFRCEFVPWKDVDSDQQKSGSVVVVDATHPTLPCLTHHRMAAHRQHGLRGDTSSDLVFAARAERSRMLRNATKVSCDHFDIDALVSVFVATRPLAARPRERLLREIARIGDFRHLSADPAQDALCRTALAVCCWINSEEKRVFARPFERGTKGAGGEGVYQDGNKWSYFLGSPSPKPSTLSAAAPMMGSPGGRPRQPPQPPPRCRFEAALDGDGLFGPWRDEFTRVLDDLGRSRELESYPEIDLCVRRFPLSRPPHYYALFGESTRSQSFSPPPHARARAHRLQASSIGSSHDA